MTGTDSYTVLETKKVREIGRGHFASLLIARHNGEEFIVKYFVNIETKKEINILRKSKF